MKELPILERGQKIEPSMGSSSFGSAYAEVAKGDLQIANFGAEIAQNASIQRQKLLGQEAGKNPQGQTPLAFTKADEAYVQSYKQEAYSSLDFKGKQLIADMQAEIASNPTKESLAAYQRNSLLAVDQLVADAPKDMAGDLQRSLEGSAQNGFYELYGSYEAKQKKDRISLWKASTDQGINAVSNLAITGSLNEATEQAKSLLAQTQERELAGDVDAGTSNKLRDTLDQTLNNGQAIFGMNRSGNPEQYLYKLDQEGWVKKLPENVRQGVIANAVKYHNQQQAAKGAQQTINYTNYQSKIMASQMTPTDWMQAQTEVSGSQFANLQQQQLKLNIKDNQGYATVSRLAPYMDNPSVLAGESDANIAAAQDYLVKNYAQQKQTDNLDLSLSDQAQALMGMRAPSKKLTNQMSAAFRSGGINEAIEAAHIHQFAKDLGNNELTSGLSAQDKMFSNIVKEKSKDAEFTPQKLEDLRQVIYNATDEQKADGLKAVSEFRKNNSIRTIGEKMEYIKDKLGAENGWFRDDTVLPMDISDTFDNLLNLYGTMTRDPYKASELAIRDLNNLYKETHVNGYKEKMALPPNQFIPDVGYVIENTLKASFASYVDRMNEAANKGLISDYTINWQSKPKGGSPFDYSRRWGDKGPVTFFINGREARLIAKTDGLTAASVKNQYTQYGVKLPNENDKTWALWYEYTDTPGASYQLRDFVTYKDKDGKEFTLEQGARFTPVEVNPAFKTKAETQQILKGLRDNALKNNPQEIFGKRLLPGAPK